MRRSIHLFRLASVTSALALSLTLSACGDDDDPDPVTQSSAAPSASASAASSAAATPAGGDHPLVGTCYTESSSSGPVRSSKVDCAQPHSAEVFAVIPNADELSKIRDLYKDTNSPERQAWRIWAEKACGQAFMRATGTTEWAKAIGLDPATQWVRPTSWTGIWTFSLSTVDEWAAGERVTLCTARAADLFAGITADDPKVPQVAGPWIQKIGAGPVPSVYNACKVYVAEGQPLKNARCEDPHWLEYAFDFDAADVFDDAFIQGLDPNNVTDEQWKTLDAVCAKAEAAVLGRERDEVRLTADVSEAVWNQKVWGQSLHAVSCVIRAEDSEHYDVVGSVVGIGDGEIKLAKVED
ncbi:hypothetical protein GCM10009547_20640 [Sporichthya brevicatena]|uniref:Septum formation-related domain-containing protein n=1 Tax=Sporichthya brevicatena TaxID=171442 RepID=A0ABP3RWB9_9ACTN